jgi:hypothetical protein
MNCRNATRLMSEAQERPLTITERMSLKLHVLMCSSCHNFKDQMNTLRSITRAYAKNKSGHMNEK